MSDIVSLGDCLANVDAPVAKQMRACFILKSIGSDEAIDELFRGMRSDSVLLKHEIMYVMGQMKNPYANKYLIKVLEDSSEDPVVRHEAAEALGAIGSESSLPILERFALDEVKEVSETCEIAVERLKWLIANEKDHADDNGGFVSVDPAPAFAKSDEVEKLREQLLDTSATLFKRYRAMFTLRNLQSEEAVDALASGFDDSSAVFRHEVAYVLGQMRHPHSKGALARVLKNTDEHPMVRHEAAEALGALDDEEVVELLKEYQTCGERIIKESCDVALDIYDYWNSNEE
jgi:deoxyhypusine monooxygenase